MTQNRPETISEPIQSLDKHIAAIDPTPEALMEIVSDMFGALEHGQKKAYPFIGRNRMFSLIQKAGQGPQAAEMALAGLKQMGTAILDSGVPQAVLTFAVTYKLLDSMSHAGQEAQDEYGISNF